MVVDPEPPALPESIPEEIAQSLSDDIVNEILTLEDVLVKLGLQNRDAEDEGEISFVKKTMQCI